LRLLNPWKKATCPFCFARFHPAEAGRRPTAPSAPQAADAELGAFLAVAPPSLPAVEGPGPAGVLRRFARRCVLHADRAGRWRPVCPRCHLYLPHKMATAELPGDIVAVVGAPGTGKTSYFGALVDALERRNAAEADFRFFDQEVFSPRELKPVGSRRLHRARVGSGPAAAGPDARLPLVYRLEFPRRLLAPAAADLILYDGAGVGPASEPFYRHLNRAAGVVILIDPLQLPGVRDRLPAALRKKLSPVELDPCATVSQILRPLEHGRIWWVGRKLRVPAAFVLAKCDLVRDLVPPASLLRNAGRHEGGFDAGDSARLSAEVRAWLREWGGEQLLQLARNRFGCHRFFAVSARCNTPAYDPFRVADPLLWILWQRGYLCGASVWGAAHA
jgi:hypothetical protein